MESPRATIPTYEMFTYFTGPSWMKHGFLWSSIKFVHWPSPFHSFEFRHYEATLFVGWRHPRRRAFVTKPDGIRLNYILSLLVRVRRAPDPWPFLTNNNAIRKETLFQKISILNYKVSSKQPEDTVNLTQFTYEAFNYCNFLKPFTH